MAVQGASVAYIVVGGLVLYSGIKGATIADTVTSVLSGNLNVTDTETVATADTSSTATSTSTSAASPSAASNQALAKQLATSMGYASWTTGTEWTAWLALWNRESGWSITAANPASTARGIAQNINGYGPDYLAGNATSQITWGINYIASRYGSPVLAEAHEQENGWY
jgi:resuscitation-promoting factor RpfB